MIKTSDKVNTTFAFCASTYLKYSLPTEKLADSEILKLETVGAKEVFSTYSATYQNSYYEFFADQQALDKINQLDFVRQDNLPNEALSPALRRGLSICSTM